MWVRLCKRLRDAKIAHADLQHGNVLLVPGETANKLKLRLIDYDGMWVPALADKPSGEVGHPPINTRPDFATESTPAEVDRFPHLVIGCALRAVAVAGKPLWDQFDNGDNLLFREADLADPSKSKVFRTLWAMDDPTITNLVALLAVSSRQPLKATPWLDDVLSGEKAKPVSDAVLDKAADLIGVEHRAAPGRSGDAALLCSRGSERVRRPLVRFRRADPAPAATKKGLRAAVRDCRRRSDAGRGCSRRAPAYPRRQGPGPAAEFGRRYADDSDRRGRSGPGQARSVQDRVGRSAGRSSTARGESASPKTSTSRDRPSANTAAAARRRTGCGSYPTAAAPLSPRPRRLESST